MSASGVGHVFDGKGRVEASEALGGGGARDSLQGVEKPRLRGDVSGVGTASQKESSTVISDTSTSPAENFIEGAGGVTRL
jgi:hypothetical protein